MIGIRGDGVLRDGVASVEIALERGQLGVETHDVGVTAIDARGQAVLGAGAFEITVVETVVGSVDESGQTVGARHGRT